MNDENKALLKRIVTVSNKVHFTRYFDGQLWYKTYLPDCDFEFPVPISDIGTATFYASDKALLFMRYIRKHMEMLEEAKNG